MQWPHCGKCTGHLFASQLQRTAELCCTKVYARAALERHPPAHKEVDLPGRARDPVRISIRPVHALHVICRPDAAPIARVPDQLFEV